MSEYERQIEEIKTIKERTVTLNLSDSDCERISRLAGEHSLTVGELLTNFIGDLVGGTYSNGSDERDKANEWFERCWFGMFPEETLLRHLLLLGHDVDDFLTACDELKYYDANPQEYADEVADLEEGQKLWFVQEYQDNTEDFLNDHKDADIGNEIELCRNWVADRQKLTGNNIDS